MKAEVLLRSFLSAELVSRKFYEVRLELQGKIYAQFVEELTVRAFELAFRTASQALCRSTGVAQEAAVAAAKKMLYALSTRPNEPLSLEHANLVLGEFGKLLDTELSNA